MISEAVLSIWNSKSNRSFFLWLALGLAIVGVASFFERDGWQSALMVPLSLLTFLVLLVVVTDLLVWVFSRVKLGKVWCLFAFAAGVLLAVLSFFGNPLPLALFAFLISVVIFGVGFIKSRISK